MTARVLKIKFLGLKADIEHEVLELKKRETVIGQSQFIENEGGTGYVLFVDVLKGVES